MSGSKESKRRATANCFYSGELASARMPMDQQLPNRSASVGGRGETYGAPDECLSMSRAWIFDSNVSRRSAIADVPANSYDFSATRALPKGPGLAGCAASEKAAGLAGFYLSLLQMAATE
jgi:hypothetical protein